MSEADETQTDDAESEQAEAEMSAAPPMAYGVPVTESRGQVVLHPTVDQYIGVVEQLRDDGFVSVVDLCGVDNLTRGPMRLPAGVPGARFEVVVSMLSHHPPRRVRIRVQIPGDEPTLPTLFDLFPGTENLEREAFDMFGIVFEDHPDPTRILMPDDWSGYPLRKDFAVGSVPVQFKDAPAPR